MCFINIFTFDILTYYYNSLHLLIVFSKEFLICVNISSQKASFIMENLRKTHELQLVSPMYPSI